jgi:hypothetical protein
MSWLTDAVLSSSKGFPGQPGAKGDRGLPGRDGLEGLPVRKHVWVHAYTLLLHVCLLCSVGAGNKPLCRTLMTLCRVWAWAWRLRPDLHGPCQSWAVASVFWSSWAALCPSLGVSESNGAMGQPSCRVQVLFFCMLVACSIAKSPKISSTSGREGRKPTFSCLGIWGSFHSFIDKYVENSLTNLYKMPFQIYKWNTINSYKWIWNLSARQNTSFLAIPQTRTNHLEYRGRCLIAHIHFLFLRLERLPLLCSYSPRLPGFLGINLFLSFLSFLFSFCQKSKDPSLALSLSDVAL